MSETAGAERVVEGPAPPGRVDLAVAAVAEISRAHAQRLIGDGRASVDGRARRANDRLVGGELIRVELSAPPDDRLEPESIPLSIAYEDSTMYVIDKPAGLVVHPSAGHPSGTLVNALLGRARDLGEPLPAISGVARPGIVHRLDKETSGLIVVARTDAAHAALTAQFAARTIDKEYLALVRGQPPAPRGRVEAPIGRDPRDRQRMAVVAGGREAATEYEVIAASADHALLALRPLTGRTHQLRAHLAYLGLPIVGDVRYGGGEGPGGLRRQFLHASRLGLSRPSDGRRLRAWSEMPDDLAASLAATDIIPPAGRLPAGIGAEVEP